MSHLTKLLDKLNALEKKLDILKAKTEKSKDPKDQEKYEELEMQYIHLIDQINNMVQKRKEQMAQNESLLDTFKRSSNPIVDELKEQITANAEEWKRQVNNTTVSYIDRAPKSTDAATEQNVIAYMQNTYAKATIGILEYDLDADKLSGREIREIKKWFNKSPLNFMNGRKLAKWVKYKYLSTESKNWAFTLTF